MGIRNASGNPGREWERAGLRILMVMVLGVTRVRVLMVIVLGVTRLRVLMVMVLGVGWAEGSDGVEPL